MNNLTMSGEQLLNQVQSLAPQMEPTSQLSFIMKAFFLLTILFSGFTVFLILLDKRRLEIQLGIVQAGRRKSTNRIKIIREYRMYLEQILNTKDKEYLADTLYNLTLFSMVSSFIFLLIMKQPILAVGFPIILIKFLHYITGYSVRQTIEDIEEQLPYALDRLIRMISKDDDLRKCLYGASLHLEEPLKSIFEDLAIKMSSGYRTDALMSLGNRFNNIWIWSFVFILTGYSTNTSKTETLESLRNLRVLLENENNNRKNQIRERKYGIAINYTLISISFAAFIANLILNPIAKDFFFASMGGLICLFGGFGSIFSTILINIKMAKRKN